MGGVVSKFTDSLDEIIDVAEREFNYDAYGSENSDLYRRIHVNLTRDGEGHKSLPEYRGYTITYRGSLRDWGFRLSINDAPLRGIDPDRFEGRGSINAEYTKADYKHPKGNQHD